MTLYTPFLWVAREASQSPQLMGSAEIDPVLLRPVLHVVALPSLPPDVGPNFGSNVSPVVDVVLQDAAHRNERFPTMRSPFLHDGLRGLVVEFPFDDVAASRAPRAEFHIIVMGTNGNIKDFTVKKKHLAELLLD